MQGLQGKIDASQQLCTALFEAYQKQDLEAIVKLGPSLSVLKEIQKSAGTPQGAGKFEYNSPKGQGSLADSIRQKASEVLKSAPGSLKSMRLVKVEAGTRLSSQQSPMIYQEQWMVLSGPEGIFRHKVFVMEYMDRLYVCDIGSWMEAEE